MAFYLTKRDHEDQCSVGERLMVLSDFYGITAGNKGTVCAVYSVGIMVEWDKLPDQPSWQRKTRDGFSREDLQYLAFETHKHPKVDPTVTRV